MFIGSQAGNASSGDHISDYLVANRNDSPLGWSSGRNLTEWIRGIYSNFDEADQLNIDRKRIELIYRELAVLWPTGRRYPASQANMRELDRCIRAMRTAGRVYGTNIIKCQTLPGPDGKDLVLDGTAEYRVLADACGRRWLREEIRRKRPAIVVPLGQLVAGDVRRLLPLDPRPRHPDDWYSACAGKLDVHSKRCLLDGISFYLLPFMHPSPRHEARWREHLPAFYAGIRRALAESLH